MDTPPPGGAAAPPDGAQVAAFDAQATMFANRLRKNDRHLQRWARREGVRCYRVYDCDIPELPLSVDRYEDALVIAWFAPPRAPADPDAFLAAMVAAAAGALDVAPSEVYARIRAPQKGASQYTRLAPAPAPRVVTEGGLRFQVDLAAHVDVGLFLDHRPLRHEVRERAAGRDVLNLFCYTGAFSVHAAAGGARSTVSVDLNRNYLATAERNFEINNLADPAAHRFVRDDVMRWLFEPHAERFDIAVVDPPTFSNSKKMDGIFDVQRAHPELLAGVIALMRPGGVVYFSTNHRKFRPAFADIPLPQAARVEPPEELSHRSVPPDFRDRRIHRAWRFDVKG